MRKCVMVLMAVLSVFMFACSQVTLIEVRVFSASNRTQLEGAKIVVMHRNSESKMIRPVAPYGNTKNQFSFNNYRIGGREKFEYIEVTVKLAGYETHVATYTNLQYLDRNNRSPYQRFLDIYLKKAGK